MNGETKLESASTVLKRLGLTSDNDGINLSSDSFKTSSGESTCNNDDLQR